ncbi:hypothetical protein ARAM_001991 [Aspergillus rambellii]|uniref:ASTRA-associated protein 1 n=1 Tax=Aspergillus rambellii TaxID=308745 RepID=A0A0F8U0Q1_9EURO|nr:hypothetical protein ARAM_001991 [Aspergillus rambellii]
MSVDTTQPRQPPATPTYILRGHVAPIHALQIFNTNLRIVSGDADGWIIVWDLVFKRPIAVWKAHEGAVLEVKGFGLAAGAMTEIYTHLKVWRFRVQDEESLQKTLPVDIGDSSQSGTGNQPWLVHSLPVNALNFCAFSMQFLETGLHTHEDDGSKPSDSVPPSSALIAVPNALDSGAIDLFHLPRERRICTIPADPTVKTGMVMAAHLTTSQSGELYVAAAYEDGHVMVFGHRGAVKEKDFSSNGSWKWEKLYISRPHSQPVLSIDVCCATGDYFLSSSADALLVKHPIPRLGASASTARTVQVEQSPLRTINTKHAGQQGLRVRSDGKIFATAGWDSRVRVYSCKTMKELAVLKWHKDGCYAVAFAHVSSISNIGDLSTTPGPESTLGKAGDEENGAQLTKREERDFSLAQVQRQRSQKVQNTHWLAAGSKDGKISLWDIY